MLGVAVNIVPLKLLTHVLVLLSVSYYYIHHFLETWNSGSSGHSGALGGLMKLGNCCTTSTSDPLHKLLETLDPGGSWNTEKTGNGVVIGDFGPWR